MIAWMTYAAGAGVLLAASGWAGERLCAAMNWPRRFSWLAALTLATVIPLLAKPAQPTIDASAMAQLAIPQTAQVAGSQAQPAAPRADRIALVVWGAASLATLALWGTILTRLAWSRRRWTRRLVCGQEVYVSERFGPALIGVARPAVVVPAWVLREGERKAGIAVLHEREHARAGDHLTLLYGTLIVALFPWSPAVWWMVRNLRGAVEIDCDRRVIASGIPAGDYGKLLLAIGVGQHRRWVVAPALVESRHSLERRLKVMAAKKMKLNPLRAAALAGLSLATVFIACDTEAPTGIDDALVELLGSPEAAADGDGAGGPPSAVQIRGVLGDGPQPLIFVDGVEVEAGYSSLNSLNPDDIERIEVIKGAAAAELYGERAEEGVIQIFTKELSEPSTNDAPPPSGDAGNKRGIQFSGTLSGSYKNSVDALGRVEGTPTRTGASMGSFNMRIERIEMTRARYYNIDSPLTDWANARELANGLTALIRQLESESLPGSTLLRGLQARKASPTPPPAS